MIDVKILSEKLKYLIIMNSKPNFDIKEIYFDFDYNENKIENYDVNIKFDYNAGIDPDVYSFAHDIQRMSEKLQNIINEYIVTPEGKIVAGDLSKGFSSDGAIWAIDYTADEKHIFDMSFRVHYTEY
jgi:hypothetical protein